MARAKPDTDAGRKPRGTSKSQGSSLSLSKVLVPALMAGVAFVSYKIRNPPKPNVPLQNHEWHYVTDIFPEEVAERWMRRVEEEGVYRTALDDVTSHYEHIGEAAPLGSPACDHPYMVVAKNRTHCVLPQRLDVGVHHAKYGGPSGAKERLPTLISRVSSFLSYIFDDLDNEELNKWLFHSPRYLERANSVCKGRPIMDPIQLNLVVVLPGSELSMHYDAPWMWGANRFTHPQWLVVVMQQSGLWADLSLPQIQGLVWLHKDGSPNNSAHGGNFFFYPEGPAGDKVRVNASFNAMLVLDGCKVIHGVERFRPERKVPLLSRLSTNELRHVGGGRWEVLSDGQKVGEYRTEELRVSLVWRARCFADAEEKARWDASVQRGERLPLEEVLDTLEADLRRRGVLREGEPRPPPVEYAELLLATYAPYPVANLDAALVPYNYCALEKRIPAWAKPLAEPILNLLCD